MFKMEKNIPIESAPRTSNSKYVEFLKKMTVGASFSQTEDGEAVTKAKVAVIRHYAKRIGIKVSVRSIGEDAYRIWRVTQSAR